MVRGGDKSIERPKAPELLENSMLTLSRSSGYHLEFWLIGNDKQYRKAKKIDEIFVFEKSYVTFVASLKI